MRFFVVQNMTAETTNTAQLLNGNGGLYTTQGLGGKKMPYKVIKTGSKFAVHKTAGNKPVGKAMGMHDSMEEAQAQMKALYANEKKAVKKEVTTFYSPSTLKPSITATITDSEGNTSTVSKELEITEDDKTKDYYDSEVAYEPYSGAISFAELEAIEEAQEAAIEVYGLTDNFTMLARCIMHRMDIEDKEAALSNLANEFIARVNKEVKEKSIDITKQIAGDNQSTKPIKETKTEENSTPSDLVIWKENGQYRWLAAYSNNRQDDEAEIISSESHKEFDQALAKKEWPMPEVYLWHIPYPVGKADYHAYDESTGFPVAAGHFYSGMEWAAEGILKENWAGNSHGMPDRWVEYSPDNPKVITRHRTKEITFLPLWAAANKLAFSIINKEKSMEEVQKGLPAHKRDEFIKAFGEERVKQMEEALSAKSKEADEAGIQKKEVEVQPEAKSLTKEDLITGLEYVLTQVKEAVDVIGTRLDALEKTQVKEADQFDIIAQLKAKSIIGNPAAKVHGNSALAKDAPIETESEAEKGPTPVGLLNNLFKANEAYYNRGGR